MFNRQDGVFPKNPFEKCEVVDSPEVEVERQEDRPYLRFAIVLGKRFGLEGEPDHRKFGHVEAGSGVRL